MVEKTSFKTYCESTSLHGWQYISKSDQSGWKCLWIGMVLSSVVVAVGFVFKQTSEFTKATVVTTVDTTTAPLSDVYFPSVTICNINQVYTQCESKACNFKKIDLISGSVKIVKHLICGVKI